MKNFVTYLTAILLIGTYSSAAPIIELAAPKTNTGEIYFFEPSSPSKQSPAAATTKQPAAKTSTTQQNKSTNATANNNKNNTKAKNNNSKTTTKNSKNTNVSKKAVKTTKNKAQTQKQSSAQPKSDKNTDVQKPAQPTVQPQKSYIPAYNYNNVSKMLEYGYYLGAENVLRQELKKNPKNVDAMALETILYVKRDKLDEAQNKLDDLLKKYPDNSDLHYAQGLLHYQRTNSSNMLYRTNSDVLLENAHNEFEKAAELNPKSAKALNALGVIDLANGNIASAKVYFLGANSADELYANAIDNLGTIDMIEGNLENAQANFEKALSINKKGVLPLYHLAQIAYIQNDYQKTLQYIHQGLELAPNAPYLLNLAGKTYNIQGNEAAAIEAYKKSVFSKPEFLASYLDLADIYNRRGDYEFAVTQLKTALNIQPDAYDVKLKIADISYANGKYNQAIDYYKTLKGISNYNEKGLKGLANSYFAKAQNCSEKSLIGSNSDIYKVLDYINKAIEANGNDLELYLAKLKLTRLTNQPQETRMVLENIVKSDGDSLVDYVIKGEAYLTLYDYKKANEQFMNAVKKSNTLKDDLYLAEIFIHHKQFEPAEAILDKIILNNPGHQEALNDLDYIAKCKRYSVNYNKSAQNFMKSRNESAAAEYFQRSLAINPNNAEAHLQLAELYDKQKEYNDALNNYRAYIGLTPAENKNSHKVKNVVKKIRKIEKRLL